MRKSIYSLSTFVVMLVTTCPQVRGDDDNYYDFHPRSVMTLGAGFSPGDPSAPKLSALDFEPESLESGALTTTLEALYIQSSTHLKHALHLDLKVDASYLVYKGGASFAYDDSATRDTHSITMVITARTEYGRRVMKNAKLNTAAKALIDAHSMNEFEKIYGSHVVLLERRGSSVSVILSISDVDDNTKSKITAGIQGSGGFGPLSASAKATFQNEMEKASQSGRLSVQVVSTGGEGFGGLAELVKSLSVKSDAMSTIQNAIGDYVKQFVDKNSVPIAFQIGSMESFGFVPSHQDLWTATKERRLLKLVDAYRTTERKLDLIDVLLKGTDPRFPALTAEKKRQLEAAAPKLEEWMDAIAKVHKECLSDTTGNMTLGKLPPPPDLPDDLIPVARPFDVSVIRVRLTDFSLSVNEALKYGMDRGNHSNAVDVRVTASVLDRDGHSTPTTTGDQLNSDFQRVPPEIQLVDTVPFNKTIIVPVHPKDMTVIISLDFKCEAGAQFTATGGHFEIVLDRNRPAWGKESETDSPKIDCVYYEHHLTGTVHYRVEYEYAATP